MGEAYQGTIMLLSMKLLGILVVYEPCKCGYELIADNLKRYLSDIDKCIVHDNTPSGVGHLDTLRIRFRELLTENEFSKLEFMDSGYNAGLSYAYNQAIEYAVQFGYTHLLTMDQDSRWENFGLYRTYAESFFEGVRSEAIIGPVVNDDTQDEALKEVPNLINSGAVIPIDVFRKIGGYCERFLVDAVDVELCYRAQRFGIPVYKVRGHGRLVQSFGDMTFFRFNGRRWYCANYSPFRLKGIVRNHMLLSRIYPEQTDTRDRLWNVYVKQYTIAIILKEKHKMKKLWTIYSSLITGFLTVKSLDSRYSKA